VPGVSTEALHEECRRRGIRVVRVFRDDLPDSRMQNTALLGEVLRSGLVPGLAAEHVTGAMEDLLQGGALEANLGILGVR